MKKMSNKLKLSLVIVVILGGLTAYLWNMNQKDYGSILNVNQQLFSYTNESANQNEVGPLIGEIKSKTTDGTSQLPSEHLQSNDLDVGLEVYAVKFPMERHEDEVVAVKIKETFYLCRPYVKE